jgi:DNA ligase (NAD+)
MSDKKIKHIQRKKISITKKYINTVIADPTKYAKESKINDIVKFLMYCSDKYYNSDEEVISDNTFDTIKDILEERDPDNYFITIVGAPVDNKDKVKLPYPMASLDKIKPGNTKLNKWRSDYPGPYSISDKLDGISAQLAKDKSGKAELFTRGDATEGKNISHLINKLVTKKAIKNMPNNTSIRGEIIIPRSYHKYIKDNYANGRAAVSGLVGADDGDYDEIVAKYARLVVYSMIHPSDKPHNKTMKMIEGYGFEVVWYKIFNKFEDDIEQQLIKLFGDRREKSLYDVDGIVCMDSSQPYEDKNTNPKHAFAFKMKTADQSKITTVVDIEWIPTMYAYIQPTVVVEPVNIGGSEIRRATGHNAKYIYDNKIGKGTKIEILKSGDVIPYIQKVITPSKKALMPDIEYEWHENGVEVIATNMTPETAQIVGVKRTAYFFRELNIKYMNIKTVEKFFQHGYNSIFKILSADHDDLTEINQVGEKMIKKLFDEIHKKIKMAKLHTLMAASLQFGRGLGAKKIRLVTAKYPNILHMDINKNDLIANINTINGFDDLSSTRFVEGLDYFKKFVKKLEKCVDIKFLTCKQKKEEKKQKKKGVDFTGEKIVFTGFRDTELTDFVTDNGGSVTGSVSSNTTIVVYVGDSDGKSAKLTKAEELNASTGKPILLTKDEFIKRYF